MNNNVEKIKREKMEEDEGRSREGRQNRKKKHETIGVKLSLFNFRVIKTQAYWDAEI
jgi:hypothetical protein